MHAAFTSGFDETDPTPTQADGIELPLTAN